MDYITNRRRVIIATPLSTGLVSVGTAILSCLASVEKLLVSSFVRFAPSLADVIHASTPLTPACSRDCIPSTTRSGGILAST